MAPKVKQASAHDGKGDTCDAYFARLAKARASERISSVRKNRYDWAKWISPRIGKRPIAEVTRDEIEEREGGGSGLVAGRDGRAGGNMTRD